MPGTYGNLDANGLLDDTTPPPADTLARVIAMFERAGAGDVVWMLGGAR